MLEQATCRWPAPAFLRKSRELEGPCVGTVVRLRPPPTRHVVESCPSQQHEHRSLDGEPTMSTVTSDTTGRYAAQHLGWPHPERIVLPEGAQPDSGVAVSNRSLLRQGRRWIPISGEIHYSRLNRRQWPLALQ